MALRLHDFLESQEGWCPKILISNFFNNIKLSGVGIIDNRIVQIWRVFEVERVVIGLGKTIPSAILEGPVEAVGPAGVFDVDGMGSVGCLGLGALGGILLGPLAPQGVQLALQAADGIPLSTDRISGPFHLIIE